MNSTCVIAIRYGPMRKYGAAWSKTRELKAGSPQGSPAAPHHTNEGRTSLTLAHRKAHAVPQAYLPKSLGSLACELTENPKTLGGV